MKQCPQKIAGIVLTAVLLLAGGSVTGFDLMKNGKGAVIVLPEKPHPSSCLAAEELSTYVGKVTGKKLAIVKGNCKAESKVYIGTLDTLKNIPPSAVKALKNAKKKEAHYILARGKALYIIGKREVADLYATYQFIEDKLGVRWLKVEEKFDPGEYVPKKKNIVFGDYEKFREPFFAFRRIDQCNSFGIVIPMKGKIWANRNGYQTPAAYGTAIPYHKPQSAKYKFYTPRIPREENCIGGGHMTFAQAMPGKTFFDKHPEYFALIDGKRVKGEQYCISNAQVRKNVANYIIQKLDASKGLGNYTFGMVDVNGGWCECSECKKLDGSDTTAHGFQNVSTRFQKTARVIAEMVYKKYPKADLRVWAYHTYRQLPEGVKIHPEMLVQFCPHGRCYGHTLDDPGCDRNVTMFNLLKDWLKVAPRIFTYEYFTASHGYYACEETVMAKDLLLYKKLGILGYKEEGCFPDSKFYPIRKNEIRMDWMPSNWQWSYAVSKLLWDPTLDLDKILEEAESLYYGKAYPAMKKYHAYRRKLWSSTPQCMGYPRGDGRKAYLLTTPGSEEKLLKLLDEADRLAKGDKLLTYRLSRDRYYLNQYWIAPNKELKKLASKTMRAPDAGGKVIIDGDGKDKAWIRAYYLTSGLKQTFRPGKKDIPPALATTLGILSDKENLYFLITAKEPAPGKMKMVGKKDVNVWADDSIELFLYPPTAANTYYHLAINPKGVIYDSLGSKPAKDFNIPVEVKTRIHKDRYVIEARVPLAKLKRPERGEIWRIFFSRNRSIDDQYTPAKENHGGHFSLDGYSNHNTAGYRPLEIGTPYLRNGSFEVLDKKGVPKDWIYRGKSSIVSRSGNNAVKLNKSHIYQLLAYGDVGQKKYPRKISYSFAASGKGDLKIHFYRYTDTTDPKAKNGYRRKIHSPSGNGGSYRLTEKTRVYHGSYTIAPNEWVGFAFFAPGEAVIDDVSVRLVK